MEVMLGHVTYGGHVTNGLDLNTVKAMVNFVATEQVKTDTVENEATYEHMDTYTDSLPDALSCQQLGLTDASSSSYQFTLSSDVADRLASCAGLQPPLVSISNHVVSVAEETVNQITKITDVIKTHDLAQEAPTAVTSFIQRELTYFFNLLEDAVKDMELLIEACSGHVAFTPSMFSLASLLGNRQAPSKWLVRHSTNASLTAWLVSVGRQINLLSEYLLYSPQHPCSFCLGTFAHPQAFLACVLMDHARSSMKSVYALEFSVEVLHPDTQPTSPPSRGVYLSGLKLTGASWDTERGCITELPGSSDTCELPIVWLKPIEVLRSRAPSAKVDKRDNDIPSYDCPFLTGGDWGTDVSTLVASFPLPSTVPEGILKKRRVAVVSMPC